MSLTTRTVSRRFALQVRARAGVRAMPPRSEEGSVPLAGRAHTSSSNVWFVTAMGARGLLYHVRCGRNHC